MLVKTTLNKQILNGLTKTISAAISSCKPLIKAALEVIVTSTPSVYTAAPIDPQYDLSMWKKEALLFKLPTKYIVPSEFNYEYPHMNVPEFAFVGRSNVGKSSLISCLLQNDTLVKISKAPGCTKSVNYFAYIKGKNTHVNYLVDLPGYGFAKGKSEDKEKWKNFIEGYLRVRPSSILRYHFFSNEQKCC